MFRGSHRGKMADHLIVNGQRAFNVCLLGPNQRISVNFSFSYQKKLSFVGFYRIFSYKIISAFWTFDYVGAKDGQPRNCKNVLVYLDIWI